MAARVCDIRLQAEERTKAQEGVQSRLKEQMAGLRRAMTDRDAQYQGQLKQQDTKFACAASPEDPAVSQLIGVKQPIQVVTPAASAGIRIPHQ